MGLKELLFGRPTFAFIATAMTLAQMAFKGVDIRPIISSLVDEIVPAIA